MAMPVNTPPRPRAPGAPPGARGAAPRAHNNNWILAIARAPYTLLETGVGIFFTVMQAGVNLIAALGQHMLPPPLIHLLRSGAQAITGGGEEVRPQVAAQKFIREFREEYGTVGPEWAECSWEDAATHAHAQFKFLLVYLHAPHHQDTPRFCRDTLCHPEVAEYLNSTFVCWGGDIRSSNAYRLSISLQVKKYPCTVLLVFSGARTRLVSSLQGRLTPDELLRGLRHAIHEHAIQLSAEQADFNERELNRRLREEQDAEYQRSLEQDRQREREREEARRQQEAAARAAQEAAAKDQALKEAEERRTREMAEALAQRKVTKRADLAPEPPAGPGTTQIRLRLPDGTVQQRRFESSAPLQRVFDFVDSLEEHSALNYVLATSYPRTILGGAALDKSLRELGLEPQAVLLVQSQDD